MEIRQIIREELRKMRLNERKKGHNVVIKIAEIIRDKYVEALTNYLKSNEDIMTSLDAKYKDYLNIKEMILQGEDSVLYSRNDVNNPWDFINDPFGFAEFMKIEICHKGVNKKNTHIKIPKKMGKELTGTDLKFSDIELNLFLQAKYIDRDLTRTRGLHGSNENNFWGISKIAITLSPEAVRDFVTSNVHLKWRVKTLIDSRFSTIIHEVQHYYDDMRDDEFTTTRHKGYDSKDNSAYYTHPTEINTFFTQAASSIGMRHSEWKDVQLAFFAHNSIRLVIQYGGEKVKKYYLKRLYTLWSKVNHKLNTNDRSKDITDKVNKVDKELSIIDKSELRNQIYYNHAQNAIIIGTLIVPTIEDEIAIHKKLIKLADIYRKDIVLDLAKGWTTSMLGVAQKYLKQLGYHKNRGSRRDYKYRQGYVRNPKR
jgi:hypothetical protein